MVAAPSYGDELECEIDVAVASADARWVLAGDSGALHVDVPVGLTYTVTHELRLGGYTLTWAEGPVDPGEGGTLVHVPTVPDEAFFHELAASYVSDLSITVTGVDAEERAQVLIPAPAAFVAWPSGREGGAVVWDLPTMEVEAPYGVLDAELRGANPAPGLTRILPNVGPVVEHVPGDEPRDGEG